MHARNLFSVCALLTFLGTTSLLAADGLPQVSDVEFQPFAAQVRRILEATDYLGSPLSTKDKASLKTLAEGEAGPDAVQRMQSILDRYCLFAVQINPEMRVKVAQGPAKAELVEQGWRQFLVKVANESGTTAPLAAVSANAASVFQSNSARTPSDQEYRKRGNNAPRNSTDLWLDLRTFDAQPLKPSLSGLRLEYRIVQLYSRDAGKREARVAFNVGQGTQDLGYRNETDVLFTVLSANDIKLSVKDEHGKPCTALFLIHDAAGRVYPSQAKRLAPDFAFHPQVYRDDGETIRLPDGDYTIQFERGPESIPEVRQVKVNSKTKRLEFKVQRWIDPSTAGYWSGDHHIHAAGCAHYTNPTEGVHAPDMMRHCLGEDLKIGANLTWGPCFDYQKQFFTGKEDKVSKYPYLLRYDIEVSGFGSHQSGHLCLLRLQDEMYPGGDSDKHWPTLGLNTLRWAKKQGAVVGPAHSGWGLEARVSAPGDAPVGSRNSGDLRGVTKDLPNYVIPPFNGIGANEYIVDVTHMVPGPGGKQVPAVDFISTVDTPYVWELNIWYHTLNVGFRTRISGETDFPCIYGERVGLGRSYVKLPGKLNYDDWCEGIREGRNYVGDGRSHLMNFKVNDVAMGEHGSELKLSAPGAVKVAATVSARLDEKVDPAVRDSSYTQKPYWNIERARVGDSSEVPVEVIVNGYPVAKRMLVADGSQQKVEFDVPIERSSWVALRILPSSHTNPIWVTVGDKPVRASKRSAEWCLKSVDQCWSQKERTYAEAEKAEAREAYQHARETYQRLLTECDRD